jgi:hypothetical protein
MCYSIPVSLLKQQSIVHTTLGLHAMVENPFNFGTAIFLYSLFVYPELLGEAEGVYL